MNPLQALAARRRAVVGLALLVALLLAASLTHQVHRRHARPAAPTTTAAPVRHPAPPHPTTTPAAAAVTSRYGISADYLDDAATPTGRRFASQVLGQHGRIRVFVAYDARGAAAPNGACTDSPAYTTGAAAWTKLLWQLTQAKADGLVAQLVFSTGTGLGGVPATPDPADPSQAADYACGVRLALQALHAVEGSGMPVDVEAWNEPENRGYARNWDRAHGACPAPAAQASSCSGPWAAAMLWYEAQTQASALRRADPTFPGVTVAALTMSEPQKLFFLDADHPALTSPSGAPYQGYYQSLYRIIHCAPGYGGCRQPADNPTDMPAAWGVHDYNDPTAQGTQDLSLFAHTLAQLNDRYAHGASASIWVTESGVQLDASGRRDANHPRGVTCPTSGSSPGTLACLVEGQPAAQAAGARAWHALAQVTAATRHGAVTVGQLFWFQFALAAQTCTAAVPCQLADGVAYRSGQSLPVLHAWDSALVDSSGRPRASFCALTGQPEASCAGQADAYADAHWVDWWQPMPQRCPAHDGAWVADNPDSGVPGGQQCYYSPSSAPPGTQLAAVSTPGGD